LVKTSTADALSIRSVSDTRIIQKIGVLDDEAYVKLLDAMKIVLNMV